MKVNAPDVLFIISSGKISSWDLESIEIRPLLLVQLKSDLTIKQGWWDQSLHVGDIGVSNKGTFFL